MSRSFVSQLVISTLTVSIALGAGCSSGGGGGGSAATGGTTTSGSGGSARSGGTTGSGGSGSGGSTSSSGGTTGSGGTVASGGTTGSGGSGTGGSGSGGQSGSGGTTGTDGGAMDRPAETAAEAGAGDTAAGALTFTSSGLKMMGAGLVFPAAHSAPMNVSPPFAWSGAPAGTMSFAITLHDVTANGTHWVIHDIAATVNMLPMGLPRMRMLTTPVMAKQKAIYGDTNGYEGPGGGGTNNYEFELWPLNVAALPANVAAMMPAQMRTSATGLKQYLAGPSVKILARGTRGGL